MSMNSEFNILKNNTFQAMFPESSQQKFWTFGSQATLDKLRIKQNRKFIKKHGTSMTKEEKTNFFLTPTEVHLLLKAYEIHMKEFCKRFDPPMPRTILGTAHHYFKRFYLNNSPMDYHPKEILATCVYLACKVEEFNVSINQFVSNIKGDRSKATDIILSNELLLMRQLNYYLTVHNPYRPIEGFLIDIKTRTSMSNPDKLRADIDEFIEIVFMTDACLLFSPSQIALAAVLNAASKAQENLDNYVTDQLFSDSKEKLAIVIGSVRRIRGMVKNIEYPIKENVKFIDKKLEQCRNQEFNPNSQIYKEKMKDMFDDDDNDIIGTSYHIGDSSADVSMLNTSQ